ncbi:hypothetical protein [Kutzneria sp. CA-103260]|uniref:hypothetical protein n=1 Tax=Kutzneria sp. CA-103260 TaxID=2802641 RepID=UPI001BAA44BA|nr:hypothetical protein [Kutzneria sp. CA-103260]QUQ68106.1 hypothetical protein JJ691_58480 [Kutzneria sp. CA-103260]
MTWPSGGSGYGDNQAGGPDYPGPQGTPGQQQQQPYGQQHSYPGYTYGQQQPQYPGYQQQQPYQSSYGGFGVYQQPPQGKPPRNRRTLTIVLALAGVLVLAGIGTTVVLLTRNGQQQAGNQTQQATAPATTSALKPQDPRVPGWQVAVSNRRNVAYDIPKTQWTRKDSDDIVSLGPSDGDFVTGTGAASYLPGFCGGKPGSVRAGTAVTASDTEGPDKSAPDIAQHWAAVAYKSADASQPTDVKVEPSQQIKIADGKVNATLAIADVAIPASADPCVPRSAKVYAAAVSTSDTGSVILVLFADQGVPNALSDDDAKKIMTSMRPAG